MMECILNQPILALFLIVSLGIALGSIQIKGLSLGLSGVIFIALLSGHFGVKIPNGVGNLGLVLFVYCVGLSAGNRFFSAFAKRGVKLVLLTLSIILAGVICTCALGYAFGISGGISAGIFAGAMTSTPALAAAIESLAEQSSGASIGYGIAYPFGVIGIVLFVQLVPRLLKYDLNKEADRVDQKNEKRIVSRLVKVTNTQLSGKVIAAHDIFDGIACKITRIAKDGRLVPLTVEDRFEPEQKILLVGQEEALPLAATFIGAFCDNPYPMDTSKERRELILTSSGYAGKSLRELDLMKNDHIIISRVSRLGFTFVPTADTVLERNDILTVVGNTQSIEAFAKKIGHRSTAINQTDLLSLGFGLSIGIFLGMLQIGLSSGNSISLGLAGGPLIAALLLGHFGKIGPFVGYIPRPTRVFLQDLGLVLFLANAGIEGGGDLLQTVRQYGFVVFLMGAVITILPMAIGYIVATKLLKMNILECLGGLCGGMTSTPALGAITEKTDSSTPVVSYAAVYPVALLLMTVGAQIIIGVLGYL